MKNIITSLYIVLATFIMCNLIDSSIVSAKDIYAFTKSDGTEYYVRTEECYYSRLAHFPQYIWLDAKIAVIRSNGTDYTDDYVYKYDIPTSSWFFTRGMGESSLNPPNHPEVYPIFLIAREYTPQRVKWY